MSKKKFEEMSADERALFAREVKTLRRGAEMTQAELAEAAKVSRATINNIERGTTTPQHDVLARVYAALGWEAPTFNEQTQGWLTIMGTIIETIPEQRREPSVHSAITVLSQGLRPLTDAELDRVVGEVENAREQGRRSEYDAAADDRDDITPGGTDEDDRAGL